jgi:hypothetical protein
MKRPKHNLQRHRARLNMNRSSCYITYEVVKCFVQNGCFVTDNLKAINKLLQIYPYWKLYNFIIKRHISDHYSTSNIHAKSMDIHINIYVLYFLGQKYK